MSDDAEAIGCPKCGSILNATAAGCDGAWHSTNRHPLLPAITDAIRRWALMYPIPAWGLAREEGTGRLAARWAEVAGRIVVEALVDQHDTDRMTRRVVAKKILARARALQADMDGDPDLAADPAIAGEIEGLWAAVRIADERTWEQSGWEVKRD